MCAIAQRSCAPTLGRAIRFAYSAPTGWFVLVAGELISQFNVAGLFNLLSIEASA